jgi:hypothetical protein
METIVARSTDIGYRAWSDAQQDGWYDEAEEEEGTQLPLFSELDDLAIELTGTEGLLFPEAVSVAERLLPGLQVFAQRWNACAWLAGNEEAKLF